MSGLDGKPKDKFSRDAAQIGYILHWVSTICSVQGVQKLEVITKLTKVYYNLYFCESFDFWKYEIYDALLFHNFFMNS